MPQINLGHKLLNYYPRRYIAKEMTENHKKDLFKSKKFRIYERYQNKKDKSMKFYRTKIS